jgi:hypothetical protein
MGAPSVGGVIVDLRSPPPDPQPSDLDLKVVSHLRGYPDELRRFSNLIKQAHPRGKSAVEFYLSRKVPGDSFLAALCRFVQAGEDIVTVVEAAGLLGVTPAQMLETAARPGFPAPLSGTERHRPWRRADLSVLAQDPLRVPSSEV